MSDNLRPGPPRLVGVREPEDLVPELRRSLAGAAAAGRLSHSDLAGRAIVAARRVRRRRRVAGLAALGTAIFTISWLPMPGPGPDGPVDFGIAYQQPTEPVSSPPESPADPIAALPVDPAAVPVDLIASGGRDLVLVTGGTTAIDLAPIQEAISAHQVGDGWAVVSPVSTQQTLWWVTRESGVAPVLTGMDAIVVDQVAVAWRLGQTLATATLSSTGQLTHQVKTTVPAGAEPVALVGGAVVLRQDGQWDVWWPTRGDYQPTWAEGVIQVFGGASDGRTAVGLVDGAPAGGAATCLALLDLERELAPVDTACGSVPAADGAAAVSPDGRWLIGSRADSPDGSAYVLDLASAFAGDTELRPTAAEAPAPSGPLVWAGPDLALYPAADRLVKVRTEVWQAEEIPVVGDIPLLVHPA